jgi:thioredoxin 1
MRAVYYFTADWCNPCKKVKPIVEEINKDSIVKFQMIDVDSEIELAKRFEIMSVPTFILMDDGKEVARLIGAQNKESLLDFIKTGLDSGDE